MEMMIVLLIVAIVAAASAPLVSKKMSRSAGTNDSPWVFTGMNGNIAYNMGGDNNDTVIIGAAKLPASLNGHTRLFIDSDDNGSHITFGNGEAEPMELTADPDNKRVGFTNQVLPQHSVALGGNQSITANSGIVSIGCNTINEGNDTVAVGNGARARKLMLLIQIVLRLAQKQKQQIDPVLQWVIVQMQVDCRVLQLVALQQALQML